MTPLYEDGDFETVAKEAEAQVLAGNLVFQKWTCAYCGGRVTHSHPNVFTTRGVHEDCTINIVDETDIKAQGCNYMLIQAGSPKGQQILRDLGNKEQ